MARPGAEFSDRHLTGIPSTGTMLLHFRDKPALEVFFTPYGVIILSRIARLERGD